jgi:hypothetical protein
MGCGVYQHVSLNMADNSRHARSFHLGMYAAAGTIGAQGDNGVGVVGVCQRGVKIIPAKFMGTRCGSYQLEIGRSKQNKTRQLQLQR